MNITIAWFSGTGNTLRAARELAAKVDGPGRNVELADMARNEKGGSNQVICFPVYGFGPPGIVRRYIKDLEDGGGKAWLLCTMGGGAGSALRVTSRLLSKKGWTVPGGAELLMPNNYPMGRLPGDVDRLVTEAVEKVQLFGETIAGGNGNRLPGNWFTAGFSLAFNAGMELNRSRARKSFSVNKSCTSCHLCRRVCPTENISLPQGLPVWGRDCEQCLRCLNVCPEYAISYMKCREKGRPQYLEPELDLSRLLLRK